MSEDHALLRQFHENRSEEAFKVLTQRHIDLVYSIALRQVNYDSHLAKDVAQEVFSALAQKSGSIKEAVAIGAWLCRSTHFAARNLMRKTRRRRNREQESQIVNEPSQSPTAEIDWDSIRPILDEAIAELKENDRTAIWLRYFENQNYSEIGKQLQLSEDATRMRIKRALDKLSILVSRRGITSTSTAITAAIGGQANISAPLGLALALSKNALSCSSNVATIGSLIGLMNTMKGALTIVAALLALSAGTVFHLKEKDKQIPTLEASLPTPHLQTKKNDDLVIDKTPKGYTLNNEDIFRLAAGLSEEERFLVYKRHLKIIMGDEAYEDGQFVDVKYLSLVMSNQVKPFLTDLFNQGDRRLSIRLLDEVANGSTRNWLQGRFKSEVLKNVNPDETKELLEQIQISPRLGSWVAYSSIQSTSQSDPLKAAI
ncbi:sigma-70 family RNA polymerase sigma factor [Puniceicoccaceae bacterium K14]|nr:sigma-70 family RNA polymerase sigma factor [Puniceicoccaceae bacterium K14]